MSGQDDGITTIAPGIARYACHWGYYLEGTKDALLRAGMAKAEWFLDGHEKNRHGKTIRTVYTEQDGIPVECRQPARGLCMVCFITGKEERDPMTCARIQAWSLNTLFGQGHALSRHVLAGTAAADPDFQRFLQAVTTKPQDPGGIQPRE